MEPKKWFQLHYKMANADEKDDGKPIIFKFQVYFVEIYTQHPPHTPPPKKKGQKKALIALIIIIVKINNSIVIK